MRTMLRPCLRRRWLRPGTVGGIALPCPRQLPTAQVYVLHAVPGLTVDVYAHGDEILSDFEPGTLTVRDLPEGATTCRSSRPARSGR